MAKELIRQFTALGMQPPLVFIHDVVRNVSLVTVASAWYSAVTFPFAVVTDVVRSKAQPTRPGLLMLRSAMRCE